MELLFILQIQIPKIAKSYKKTKHKFLNCFNKIKQDLVSVQANMQANSKEKILKDDSTFTKSLSTFLISQNSKGQSSSNNEAIIKMAAKLNNISQSIDISLLKHNPLNLLQNDMHGQKIKNDPQMTLVKLRKLQNRAQIQRADLEINQLRHKKSKDLIRKRNSVSHDQKSSEQKAKTKLSYLKIYQTYLKQKQMESCRRQRYEEDDQDENQDYKQANIDINIFSIIKNHPRLMDLTVSRRNALEAVKEKQLQNTERKSYLAKRIKEPQDISEYYQQMNLQQKRQEKKYIENPEKIIERQITKFYLKKNPGKLTHQAEVNQRSLSLIKKQKKISFMIEEGKMAKEDKKKLQNKFNDLANQLARSDRRKSLGSLLPQLKQLPRVHYPLINQNPVNRKMSNFQQPLN